MGEIGQILVVFFMCEALRISASFQKKLMDFLEPKKKNRRTVDTLLIKPNYLVWLRNRHRTYHYTMTFHFIPTKTSFVALLALLTTSLASDCDDTVDIACSLDNFSTLCTAIQVAGLEDALGSGDWTVFAPTNDAFAKLGDMLDVVLDDTALLKDILLFHAVDDVVSSADLECTGLVEMANHQKSRTVCENGSIYQKGGNNPRNDMPKIITTDVPTCQGFIHAVDEVLLPGRLKMTTPPPPEKCYSIADMACSMDDFSTLCSAVMIAGLAETLSSGEFTVFAPNNDAFGKLDPTLLDTVLSNPAVLKDILLFHTVVDHTLYAEDLACTHLLHMANGDASRTVCKSGGDVFQKGGSNPRTAMPKIIQADVRACNGVVHVVNEVLLP